QTLAKIKKDTDRDYWMGAEEAVKYGLVHQIVTNQSEIA
ncbi:MAG: ATP-dependent Clp protease proteolytic subunit, partial [Pseudomonadota bacterium]